MRVLLNALAATALIIFAIVPARSLTLQLDAYSYDFGEIAFPQTRTSTVSFRIVPGLLEQVFGVEFGPHPFNDPVFHISALYGDFPTCELTCNANITFDALFATRELGTHFGEFYIDVFFSDETGVQPIRRVATLRPFGEIVAAVPLPAALPLFATGLGVLTLLARRRKPSSTSVNAAGWSYAGS